MIDQGGGRLGFDRGFIRSSHQVLGQQEEDQRKGEEQKKVVADKFYKLFHGYFRLTVQVGKGGHFNPGEKKQNGKLPFPVSLFGPGR